MIRGIRGAVSVRANTREAIVSATQRLLKRLQTANGLSPEGTVTIQFTATSDLTAVSPAAAARGLGWTRVPLFCATEPQIEGAPPRIVRVLLLVETRLPPRAIRHLYLGRAATLRPDLADP